MRAQGALEYLIIIAAVLGITAVVVIFITGAFSGSSAGADLSKCRLAAANCQRDITFGLGASCTYCETACVDSAGLDLISGTLGCGDACMQCKTGSVVSGNELPGADLRAYWGFDEGIGITALDSSGNGNNGIYSGETFYHGTLYNGPIWATGTQGGAIRFDGLNDYVGVRDSAPLDYLGGNMTLSAWVNIDTNEITGGWIFSKPWNGNGEYNYGLTVLGDSRIEFRVMGNLYASIVTAVAVPKGSWHHVAATVDSAKSMKIYIDGVECASGIHTLTSWVPPSGDYNHDLAIGTLYPYGEGWPGVISHAFNGTIDSARLWNKSLNVSQIQAEMNSARPVVRATGSWEFEQGAGLYANDTHIWVAGRKGSAISFDGVDDAMQVPDSSSLEPRNITISLWVKNLVTVSTTYDQLILSKDTTSYTSTGYALTYGWGSSLHWRVGNGVTNDIAVVGIVRGDVWHHIAGTFSNGAQTLYLDGVRVGSNTLAFDIPYNGYPLSIGKVGSYRLLGAIDEIRIYGRVLSESEIMAIYNS